VTAVRCTVVAAYAAGDRVLVPVRRSKMNQDGETNDVRHLKNDAACAIRTLRVASSPEPDDCRVPLLAQTIGLRLTAEHWAAGA